jgi:hypothetical protein
VAVEGCPDDELDARLVSAAAGDFSQLLTTFLLCLVITSLPSEESAELK